MSHRKCGSLFFMQKQRDFYFEDLKKCLAEEILLAVYCSNGLKGTTEQVLIGTILQDIENPVRLGRIICSFDPCFSCATHLISDGKHIKTIKVVQ